MTEKKGRDIIEWNKDELATLLARTLNRQIEANQGKITFEVVHDFITDLLTRQAEKSYNKGFKDARLKYDHS